MERNQEQLTQMWDLIHQFCHQDGADLIKEDLNHLMYRCATNSLQSKKMDPSPGELLSLRQASHFINSLMRLVNQ